MTRDQHEAEIAALEKALAEKRAQLAEMEEPDWEAWRPALEAGYAAAGSGFTVATPMDEGDKRNIRQIIAALPLAPAKPVDEQWIERTADKVAASFLTVTERTPRQAAIYAIHETLARGARWPGDGEIAQIAAQVTAFGPTPYEAALEMARRLKARILPEGGAA